MNVKTLFPKVEHSLQVDVSEKFNNNYILLTDDTSKKIDTVYFIDRQNGNVFEIVYSVGANNYTLKLPTGKEITLSRDAIEDFISQLIVST